MSRDKYRIKIPNQLTDEITRTQANSFFFETNFCKTRGEEEIK